MILFFYLISTIILKNDRIFMISNRGEINFLFIKISALMYKNTLYKCNTNDWSLLCSII